MQAFTIILRSIVKAVKKENGNMLNTGLLTAFNALLKTIKCDCQIIRITLMKQATR